MTELSIRPATQDDLSTILALVAQDTMGYYTEPPEVTDRQRAALDEITADAHQDLLVGEVDGRVVATAQVTWMRMLSADGGLYCQVEAVRTEESLRGQGLGRQLMTHIENEARSHRAARIQLTTNRERIRAHAFYERLGYAPSHIGMKKYL